MFSYYRISLLISMMPLLFVHGKAQCSEWCNLEDCNGVETTACEGANSRLLTSLFPVLENKDQVVNIFFISTTDVMLASYTFYNASLINLEAISIREAPLRKIADGAFAGLPLQSLILSSTQLQAFSLGILEGLDPSVLQTINLANNQISYLSSDLLPFLSNMSTGSTINLMSNPLMCDCHMSWVSQLPSSVMIQNAICMEPVALQGQSLLSVLPQLNQTCPDICSTSLNNCPLGTNCSQGSYPDPFICICQPGVSDTTECVDIDECVTSRPCAPTEICINTRTSYMCYNCTPTAIVNTNSTTYDCELCPQGFIANLTENYCQRCPIGTIMDIPNNTCLECPAGSIANTTENYCLQCPPTSIVDRANNQCQKCPPGYIAKINQNYCQECPLRSIVDIPNNQCQECPAGSIANTTGNYCEQCPPTSIVAHTSNTCQECPQGYIASISQNYCQNISVPSLRVTSANIEILNGKAVVFQCTPSDDNLELYWKYQTSYASGIVASNDISQSKFLSESPLLHQLILPVATENDTGNYTCIVQGYYGNDVLIHQTVSLTVLPACGSLDRFSHGILWPITEAGETVDIFCNNVNPLFGFGPYVTRRCREDATWSRVDTSQCSIRPMQPQSTIVVYTFYVEMDSTNITNITSTEITRLRRLFNNSPLISTELTILPDQLYVLQSTTDSNANATSQNKGRQIGSVDYSLLVPVIFTVTIMDSAVSIEYVIQMIQSINASSNRDEIIRFNGVDVCECIPNSENLEQTAEVDICIGPPVNPCVCDNSGCRCNEEGYAGDGSLCARDTDRDTFPDVTLTCSLPTCFADECPLIFSNGSDKTPCQALPNAGCPTENDTAYGIVWPSTAINTNATNTCPNGTGTAVRLCNINGKWETPVVTNCSSYEYRTLMVLMAQIMQAETSAVIASKIKHLTSSLSMVSNRTDEGTSAYPTDLLNANLLLQFVLDTIEQQLDGIATNETAQNIANCFSNILSPINNIGWIELNETNAGQIQMMLINSERFGLLLAKYLEVGSNQIIASENILIIAKLVDGSDIRDVTFPDVNSVSNSIFIPASFIQQRSLTTGIDPVPIVNIHYENIQNILRSPNTRLVSQVLSSQVTDTFDTSPDIAVQLTFEYTADKIDSLPVCGFWNFSFNDGRGGWDTRGVSVVSIDNNISTITCNSTHLTSFAVLVDVSGSHQDIPRIERKALSIVSYIGCGISMVCLLIAITVLLYYRKIMLREIHNFIHLNLAIALLLSLAVFVSGIENATNSEAGCTIVAALLHYFLTAAFSWMLCEGILMYLLLVKVFDSGLGERKLFYFALGWGIPIPIVAISAGISHDQYGNDEFCWIEIKKGAIWGFVAPMLTIIIVNVIFLSLSLHSLYKSSSDPHKIRLQAAHQVKLVRFILKATVILLPLLGITWVFGILAVNQESSAFAWIFTIFNSLQGMFILIFHVIRNEKFRQNISPCWKSKNSQKYSSASRGTTRSNNIRESVIKNTRTQGASTNLSNSNTSELRAINNIFLQESIESIVIDNESGSFGNEDFIVDETGSEAKSEEVAISQHSS